ncbi:MAG TPA: hypothetical protein VGJ04_00960 [Pirellulales bacterium]
MNLMKPKDLFRVIVAVFGLWGIFVGALDMIAGVCYTLGLADHPHESARYYGVRGLLTLILGVVVMVVFPIADWAFPEKYDSEEQNSQD